MILRTTEKRKAQKRIDKIVEELLEWAREQNLATNPEKVRILADSVRRYWSVSRYELSEIVNEVLERIAANDIMGLCPFCGEERELFECEYCKCRYCEKHIEPREHNCLGYRWKKVIKKKGTRTLALGPTALPYK